MWLAIGVVLVIAVGVAVAYVVYRPRVKPVASVLPRGRSPGADPLVREAGRVTARHHPGGVRRPQPLPPPPETGPTGADILHRIRVKHVGSYKIVTTSDPEGHKLKRVLWEHADGTVVKGEGQTTLQAIHQLAAGLGIDTR